jgi:hypothetical protein
MRAAAQQRKATRTPVADRRRRSPYLSAISTTATLVVPSPEPQPQPPAAAALFSGEPFPPETSERGDAGGLSPW